MAASTEHLTINYRYIAAYNEVNARITQRQQALTLFVTLVLGLLAALMAARNTQFFSEPTVVGLMVGFPVASACLTFLNVKFERLITNLRRYLCELEQFNNADNTLPSFNAERRWADNVISARRYHDYTCAILVAAGNAVGIGTFLNMGPHNAVAWTVAIVAILTAAACVAAHLAIYRLNYRPLDRASDHTAA